MRDTPGPQRGMPEQSVQAIRAPRLVASEPRIEATNLQLTDQTDVAGPTAGASAPVTPAPVRQARAEAPDPLRAYDRIAALSAVPDTPPPAPAQGRQGMTALATAQTWLAAAADGLRLYWQQIGLAVAITLGAGMLFWRLGERSRHAEQEMIEARGRGDIAGQAPDAASVITRPVLDLDRAIEPEVDVEVFEDVVPSIRLSRPSIRQGAHKEAAPAPHEELLLDGDDMAGPAVPTAQPHYATLRAAIEAMKTDRTRGPAVDA
jgi:hypothetical protein